MRLHDGEPIGQALRRFKKLVQRNRQGKQWKPHQWLFRTPYFVRNTEIRRAKEFRKWYKSRRATLQARSEGKQPPPSV
jgi:ribosomal protein S21